MMKNLYRGEVFYLIASPLDHVEAYRYFEDGGLAVVDGKIVEAGPFEAMRSRYPDFPVTDYSGKLITPGFIDMLTQYQYTDIGRAKPKSFKNKLKKFFKTISKN